MPNMNDLFNRFVDIALVVGTRLAELPFAAVFVLLLGGVSAVVLARYGLDRYRGRRGPLWPRYRRALLWTFAVGIALHLVQRMDLLLAELRELHYYVRRSAVEEALIREPVHTSRPVIDRSAVRALLEDFLDPVEVWFATLDDGIELATFHREGSRPLAGYVAVIDLGTPHLHIDITESMGEKRLTSDFARERGCVVAINGEAGMSPARDAPLGTYQGFWRVEGKTLLAPENCERPCLTFDRENRGHYYRTELVAEAESDESIFNAIWGRGDLLLEGRFVPNPNPRWSEENPRTLMGLDASGTRLILAVIDGRQLGHSMGLDLRYSARLMAAFGARNAMWCDQGGSSTLYLGCLAGPVNRPSDGRERPVYTHFGVSLR